MNSSARKPTRRDLLRVSGLVGLATAGWSLTGCSGMFGKDSPATGGSGTGGGSSSSGAKTLRVSFTTVDTLDPQVITNGMWILNRGILEGLVVQNERGDGVLPASAESWKISTDRMTYTFTMRQSAKWSNGKRVTASDFERTLKRLFTPSGGSTGGTTMGANSYQVSTGIKGAKDFLAGALKDWSQVGVKANGDDQLVITLETPNPDLLLALTHPAFLPLYMDNVEKMPQGWQQPPNFVSNGPFTVEKWVKNSKLELGRNKSYWDAKNVSLDHITVFIVEATTTGTGTVPYENGETDILGLQDADVLRFEKDPKLKSQMKSMPTYSIAYLAKLRSENPALDDVRVRKALSLALGRDRLAQISPGVRPGLSLVTDRVKGWNDSIALEEDIAQAKQLLAQAGYPGGKGLPEIRILAGVTSTLIDGIIDNWKKNLGIKARADIVEAGVYVERRWQVQKGNYIGFYFGTFAGLPTWPTMVGALWAPTDVQGMTLPPKYWTQYQAVQANTKLDADAKTKQMTGLLTAHASKGALQMGDLVAQAFKEPDADKRMALFQQAAKLREDEFVYVPIVWSSVYFAVRPTVHNLQLRPYPDFFYFKPISMSA